MRKQKWTLWTCFLGLALGIVVGCATPEVPRIVRVFDREGRPIQGARVFIVGRARVARGMTGSDGSATVFTIGEKVSLVVERPGYKTTQIPTTTNVLIRVMLEQN